MTQLHPASESLLSSAPPTFDALPLSHEVRKAVDALGYTHPTPVQHAVFASVAAGRDVVVQARTGTGKTAAFGLPVIDRIVQVDRKKPQVLVLCPTRELALQIHRELELLGKFKGVSTTAIYGGAAIKPQIDAIAGGAQVIAGTPGRVLDHLERGTLKPKSITALVLDESDEMLSMGFLPQITKIMEQLPPEHQTLLFSATLPPDVKRIADSRLKDPEFITLSGDHIGALSIEHYVYRSTGRKAQELVQLVEIENPESAIIFCNTRDQTKTLASALQKQGYAADWLNADLSQKDREKVMAATREGKLRFLVCTDVAARGIDISHLTHVINADFPESTENYVHRTGRTGRAGRTGTALSLITPQDVGNLYMLRLTYKIFPVERDLPRPLELKTRREADLVQFLLQAYSGAQLGSTDRSLARRLLTSDHAELVVAGLLADHFGAHPQAVETASSLRREALPSPVQVDTSEKKKKKKKKKDKHKRDSAASVASADGVAELDLLQDQPDLNEETDLLGQAPEATSWTQEAVETRANDNLPDPEDLEVVSAADLLSAEEQAILRGDGPTLEPASTAAWSVSPDLSVQRAAEEAHHVARVFVNIGTQDAVTEEDFLDTLADTGFPIAQVLDVTLKHNHTFVSVPRSFLDQAVSCLNGEDVGGLEVRAEEARERKAFRHHGSTPSHSRPGSAPRTDGTAPRKRPRDRDRSRQSRQSRP